MKLKISTVTSGLLLAFATAASATQIDLGLMVPGVSLAHVRAFSGVLDDTLTFTLAADAVDFRGSVNSAVGFDANSNPQPIQGFEAELTGPNGYHSDWSYFIGNVGTISVPFIVESRIGREDALAAGTYSLHLTGTGITNDAYDLHMGVATPVPEPATASIVLLGVVMLAAAGRRR